MDGAEAAILCTKEVVKATGKPYIKILGFTINLALNSGKNSSSRNLFHRISPFFAAIHDAFLFSSVSVSKATR